MLDSKPDRKRIVVAVLLIVLLQCTMLFYWQFQRGNFFIDELFCFEYANSYATEETPHLIDREEWKNGSWMDVNDLHSMLKVGEREALIRLPLKEQMKLLVHKRTYYGLLNMLMYTAGENTSFFQYAWYALALNIWFYLVAEALLAYCVRKLTGSDKTMVLSIIMFGFSAIIMSMCEYIRFYMLTIMLMLVVIACHQDMWKEKNTVRYFALELIAFASSYFAFIHSELMLIVCGSLFCFFFIGMLCHRKFTYALVYAVPILFGMYHYVYKKTNLIQIMMHPSDYMDPEWGVGTVTTAFVNWTPENGWMNLQWVFNIISAKWLGEWYMIIAMIVIVLSFPIYRLLLKRTKKVDLIKGIKDIEENKGFIIILTMTALTDLLFIILTNLAYDRYVSFLIVLLMILFWYMAGRLERYYDCKAFAICIAVLAIVSAGLCQKAENFPFLYTNDAMNRIGITDHDELDSLMIYRSRTASLDCIVNVKDGTRLYFFEPDKEPDVSKVDALPETFMAWCTYDGSADPLLRSIENNDYQIQIIGRTHVSEVYLCTRE